MACGQAAKSEAFRYFSEFILPTCRQIADTGLLIQILQGQIEEWDETEGDPASGARAEILRVTLAIVEARTRCAVEAAQAVVDRTPAFYDLSALRGDRH